MMMRCSRTLERRRGWEYVEAPAFQQFKSEKQGTRTTNPIATLADAAGQDSKTEHPEKEKSR